MTTLTLELPQHLAEKLAGADHQTVVEALEIGLALRTSEGDGQATEHPHIIRVPGILSGRPIIRGSRIPVWQVAHSIIHLGDTVEDYLTDHPHLVAAEIYDALSYYFDHREAVEREIEENKTENVVKAVGMTIDARGFAHFSEEESADRER
ncbi:MAG: DUF433 domain-containing protein [Chloroflexi bacterium]|nr:DUF433 domain-containing protein [Chloroflexota bacterium]